MKKLETIQTKEKLNDVFAVDDPGPGGAHHMYSICKKDTAEIDSNGGLHFGKEGVLATIQFQSGARKDPNAIHGVLNCDLLEIVRDQLIDFQKGPFACAENAHALEHVENALRWLNIRTENRIKRGVLGMEQQ